MGNEKCNCTMNQEKSAAIPHTHSRTQIRTVLGTKGREANLFWTISCITQFSWFSVWPLWATHLTSCSIVFPHWNVRGMFHQYMYSNIQWCWWTPPIMCITLQQYINYSSALQLQTNYNLSPDGQTETNV